MKDEILQEAKIEAARRHISLTALIEEALADSLGKSTIDKDDLQDFKVITFKGNGLLEGVDLNDRDSLLDRMDDVSF